MISQKMQDAINDQINAEFWSAYLYLSMAMKYEDEGLSGIANWFRIQFKEEQDHAMIFINYLIQRDGRVLLKPIEAVDTDWESPLEAFKATLAHERKVTSMIRNLYALAEEDNDYATRDRLAWFITEQVEEEETVKNLITKFKLVGTDGTGILMLDNELGARTYTTPSPLATNA